MLAPASACHDRACDRIRHRLAAGITAHTTQTERLRVHWLEAGPPHGVPVILVHGNLSTSRFLEHVPAAAPSRFRFVLPDMRGFGRTEPLPIDATRGLRDWSDDIHALDTGIQADLHPGRYGEQCSPWTTCG